MISPEIDTTVMCDVLVVGGGLAGCWSAISAKEGGAEKVVLADKGRVGRSGQSPFAAGIFTVFDPSEDDYDVWMKEVVEGGEYMNDQEWIRLMFERTYPLVKKMDDWGAGYGYTVFEKTEDGKFLRRRSRGHINTWHNLVNSIPMMDTMRKKVKEAGVSILDNVMVTDLLTDRDRVIGALGLAYRERRSCLLLSKSTIISASGCGLKSAFVGHKNLTGDLQSAAFEAGAILNKMENTISNTCARNYDIHGLNLYVGVGGKFINGVGEEFMWQYHQVLGNRARQQDLVLAFCREIEEGRGPIYLDMSAASPQDQALCRKILPESFMLWDRAGINPFEERIEWIPAFQPSITSGGGIKIDLNCQSNLPGLWAAGDITSLPPHGTHSIGGLNIAFAAISGYLAGGQAAQHAEGGSQSFSRQSRKRAEDLILQRLLPLTRKEGARPDEVITLVQEAMIPYRYGYLRSKESILESLGKLREIRQDMLPRLAVREPHDLVKAIESANMAKVAWLIMESALFREESRGFHYRIDFPMTDNVNWLKWVLLKRDGDGVKTWAEDVPTPYIKPREDYSKPPGTRRDHDRVVQL